MNTEHGFGTGGIVDKVDKRDIQWSYIASAPIPFNWEVGYDVETELQTFLRKGDFKLPIKNQNGSSSCGGQAMSSYFSVLETFNTGTFEERSAKYIYAQCAVPSGGSAGRDLCKLCKDQGSCRETVLSSYEQGKPPSEAYIANKGDINDSHRLDAATVKAYSYANVETDMETVAMAIRDNKGVVLGVVGENNGTWLSSFPQPIKEKKSVWRHWVYAGKVKKINGKKYIGILNSWGVEIGHEGWQWISEDHFNTWIGDDRAIFQVWTLVFTDKPKSLRHTFSVDISLGAKNDEVKLLQDALKLDGCFPSGVESSGYYGEITRLSVKKFQEKYSVGNPIIRYFNAGKLVGGMTREQLNRLFS